MTGDTIAVVSVRVPWIRRADRWPVQVQESFGFAEQLGFRVLDSNTYRRGTWTLLANGDAGLHLDCDMDNRSLFVTLIRLSNGQLPPQWWEPRAPRVALGFREVAELIDPESLADEAGLPVINSEADRAPHLRFWAAVLQTVAADWLHGDEAWFDRVESQYRELYG